MALEARLLVVVDPTSDNHPTIDRVLQQMHAGLPHYKPEVTLLLAIDHSSTDTHASNPALFRDEQFLHKLAEPLRDLGLATRIRISWSQDWADSIIANAEAVDATTVLVSHPGETASKSLSDEYWHLIRHCPVPVGIIQSNARADIAKTIVVSMDVQDSKLGGLNKRILKAGKLTAEMHGAELHLINAYGDSSSYPDRGKIVAATGLANDHIHLKAGEPDEVLAEICRDLNPELVIIGATRRTGLKAALRGRKIGQILKNIHRHVYVVT
jgi:universal stress protein E